MMRIIVAGGAGFIGSHLCEKLVKMGNEVTIIDNLDSGLESNISDIRDKVVFIKSDISTIESLPAFDIMINLASRASRMEWERFPVEVALSNAIGSNILIKQAIKNDALYIYASSSEVYGDPDIFPTAESYIGRVSTLGTRSPYDEGKRFGESLTKAYEREYGLKNIIVRFFNTYGPRMRAGDLYGRVIDRFIEQSLKNEAITIYGDGTQTRSFTYIDDSVNAILMLIERGKHGDIYNLGNDEETRVIDLAAMIKRICNSDSPIEYMAKPPDDPKRRSADVSKIRELGFKHEISLETGLTRMVQWYKNENKH